MNIGEKCINRITRDRKEVEGELRILPHGG